MTFGLWFEDNENERIRIERLVDEATDFLAPHFGVIEEKTWDKIQFPIVEIGKNPDYDPHFNIIHLPYSIKKGNSSIGHEVSHWFHKQLNKKVFSETTNYRNYRSDNLLEFIALYGGIIYAGFNRLLEKNQLTKKFTLQKVAKMSREEIAKQIPELGKEYQNLLLEKVKIIE